MYITEKMKLNKFRVCNIPRPSEMFSRLGYKSPVESMYSGDDIQKPGNTLDNFALMEQLDNERQLEESKLND